MTIAPHQPHQHYSRMRNITQKTIEDAEKMRTVTIMRKGTRFIEWKVGKRVVLNDEKFGFDRIMCRVREIRYFLGEDYKVYTELMLEPRCNRCRLFHRSTHNAWARRKGE